MAVRKVLVVEDDFFIRELYERALSMFGLMVVTASDGKEAIDIFEKESPDIVLLDVMLPEISGMEVLKFIKNKAKQTGDVPVVMISNLDTDESINEALSLGASSYKVKARVSPLAVAQDIDTLLKQQNGQG